MISEEEAKQMAEEAWVERKSREKGDVPLSTFEERATRKQFREWWERQYGADEDEELPEPEGSTMSSGY